MAEPDQDVFVRQASVCGTGIDNARKDKCTIGIALHGRIGANDGRVFGFQTKNSNTVKFFSPIPPEYRKPIREYFRERFPEFELTFRETWES